MWTLAGTRWQFWRHLVYRRELPALLLLSLLLLFMERSGTPISERVKLWVTDAATPLLEVTALGGRISESLRQRIGDHFAVVERNDRLREENAELLEWRGRFLESQHRLQRYEELLQAVNLPEALSPTARVISEIGGPFEQAVILQAGREHGISYGRGVVDARGLVGRIIGVGKRTSRVLLLTDFNSRIPVLIKPGDIPGIVSGDNSELLHLQYLPDDEAVSPGDQVITSGDGGFLPSGLPVGVIVAVDGEVPVVRPFLEARRLEWVRILNKASLHDIPPNDPSGAIKKEYIAVSAKEEAPLP